MFKFIKKIFKKAKSFLSRFFDLDVSDIVEEIGESALEVVTVVEKQNQGMSSEGKFREAQKLLTQILFQRAIKFTKNALNIALEMAVGVFKSEGAK